MMCCNKFNNLKMHRHSIVESRKFKLKHHTSIATITSNFYKILQQPPLYIFHTQSASITSITKPPLPDLSQLYLIDKNTTQTTIKSIFVFMNFNINISQFK